MTETHRLVIDLMSVDDIEILFESEDAANGAVIRFVQEINRTSTNPFLRLKDVAEEADEGHFIAKDKIIQFKLEPLHHWEVRHYAKDL